MHLKHSSQTTEFNNIFEDNEDKIISVQGFPLLCLHQSRGLTHSHKYYIWRNNTLVDKPIKLAFKLYSETLYHDIGNDMQCFRCYD